MDHVLRHSEDPVTLLSVQQTATQQFQLYYNTDLSGTTETTKKTTHRMSGIGVSIFAFEVGSEIS